MKSFVKWIVAGVIVLVIGVVVLIIGISCGALNGENVDYEMQTFRSSSANALSLDIAAGKLNAEFYDGDELVIEYPTANRAGYTVTERANGKIEVRPVRTFWNWLGWKRWVNMPDITVKIPQAAVYDFDIDLSAGTVNIPSGNYGTFDLDISAGTCNIGDIAAADFTCDISAGTLVAGNVACNRFELELSAGKATVGGAACAKMEIDISAGDADVKNVECGAIDIDLSAGSLSVSVLGAKSDYSIFVDRSAGSCNVSNQAGADANKRMNVDISAGSVNVSFSD